jgi:hypothetical protein
MATRQEIIKTILNIIFIQDAEIEQRFADLVQAFDKTGT